MKPRIALILCLLLAAAIFGQQLSTPWSSYAHDAQHTAISSVAAQPLNSIHWQTPVDLNPQVTNGDILIHYGSPLVTAANTVVVPVKTGATDGFRLDVRNGSDGSLKYMLSTDYTLPPHNWTPSYGPVITARNRLYWAGAGGTVYYRDQPDSNTGATGQIAFYGNVNYTNFSSQFNSTVMVSTPLMGDRYGDIFFGYTVTGSNPLNLAGGIAKIDYNGVGSYITASAAAGNDPSVNRIPLNSTPALSNDQKTLYFSVAGGGDFGYGALTSVDSRNLSPIAHKPLSDPKSGQAAYLVDDGTAAPMVGPDGDVYYGVLENPSYSNHQRGWLLHFNGALTKEYVPGAFGWDDTASVVSSKLVASYHGASSYLVLTKYNNYGETGGDGVNKVAVLDPGVSMSDPISGILVMNEVITQTGVTPDSDFRPGLPNAVREWCINTAAIDPFTKAAMVNSEDGHLYRWDFTSNTLSQSIALAGAIGEAYTPTVIGVDGTVYAINHAVLFAVGK